MYFSLTWLPGEVILLVLQVKRGFGMTTRHFSIFKTVWAQHNHQLFLLLLSHTACELFGWSNMSVYLQMWLDFCISRQSLNEPNMTGAPPAPNSPTTWNVGTRGSEAWPCNLSSLLFCHDWKLLLCSRNEFGLFGRAGKGEGKTRSRKG